LWLQHTPTIFCLAAACLQQVGSFSPHSITDTAWALANALQQQPQAVTEPVVQQLVAGLCAAAADKALRLNPAMIADLLW
jgi:hypothetical protein